MEEVTYLIVMVKKMNNLNINWKTFKISDIFETIDNQVPTGAYINKRELKPGLIPRVTVKDTNNGIDSYCESNNSNFRIYENFISVSFLGSVFYHPYKASIDMKVHALLLKERTLNRNLAEYFKVLIRENMYSFTYGNQLSSKDLARLKIMLPVNDAGTPNYEYMENCIAEILDDKIELVKKYCKENMLNIIPQKIMNLKNKKWLPFKLNDICIVQSGIDIYDSERISGDIPYITSTSINNGIKYFVSNVNKTMCKNSISVNRNGSVGFAFYHKYNALYSNDCRKLTLKKCNNEYISLFITNQIMRQKGKYGYGYKMGTARLLKQNILLPVNNNDKPDYEYMEQYIKNIMYNQYSRYLDFLED